MGRPARSPDISIVISDLNSARYALGGRGRPLTKIQPGKPLTNTRNPIALALGGAVVDGESVFLPGDKGEKVASAWGSKTRRIDSVDREVEPADQLVAVPLTDELQRFLKFFDEGQLPDFVKANGTKKSSEPDESD